MDEHEDQDHAQEKPVPLAVGTFALYGMPDGGFRLVTDTEGRGVEHRTLPGKLVRLVQGMRGKMFGALFGAVEGGEGPS